MNNKPTEEEIKASKEETVHHIMRGVVSGMAIGLSQDNLKRIVEIGWEEVYQEMKPTLDRLRKHDTGEEEIKPIKI